MAGAVHLVGTFLASSLSAHNGTCGFRQTILVNDGFRAMRLAFRKSLVLIAVVVILLGMPLLLTPHRIRPSTFDLVRHGMSEGQVAELLDARPGNYDGHHPGRMALYNDAGGAKGSDVWCSRHGCIRVWFDHEGRVMAHTTGGSEPAVWWARILERCRSRTTATNSGPAVLSLPVRVQPSTPEESP
jgi:hypothetical protein